MKCPVCCGDGNRSIEKLPGGDQLRYCSTCQGTGDVIDVTGHKRENLGSRVRGRWYASPYVHKTYFKTKGGCFVSTAVCTALGKDDNCEELLLLRSFRDQILLKSVEGARLVENYYRCSPDLLSRLEVRSLDDPHIYERVYRCHLDPIIGLVRLGRNMKAIEAYIAMVANIGGWTTGTDVYGRSFSFKQEVCGTLDSANMVGRADG